MNKKISQFEVTSTFEDGDILTLVQDGTNKIIHKDDFETSLSGTFATNERVDGIEEDIDALDQKVDNNYTDLSDKIVEGDTNVTNNLTSNINEYYDVLNNKIITLEDKHDKDVSEVNDTVQGWIDEIDNKGDKNDLQDLLNRIIENENLLTAIADLIANGGGSGETPGFHTQPTSTIFPLSGYYKGENADPLATTDTLNQALAKLECQIDNISGSSSGSLPLIKMGQTTATSDGTIYTSGKVDEDYLRNSGDTATGYTTFLAGIQGGSQFREGWDGVGASLFPISGGDKWKFEVDELFVRGAMTVNELVVNEIKAVGGDILVTLADMEIVEVEDISDGWRCYFDTEDGTKYNQFRVRDQAICQKFDGKNVKRYWRMVSEVGDDYIVLSKSVCESGSGNPEVGDKVLLLGHRYEADESVNESMKDRRNAIFISAKGEGAPRIAFYSNIDDFTLVNKDRTVIGGENSKFVGTIMQTTNTGDLVRVPIYRGEWNADTVYNYYDQVTYQGSLWIAMTDNVTSVPSIDNDEWQLQVSKGDQGQAGDDVARWVEITGSRLFLYDTPDYSGTPNPASVSLLCNTYGMTNPTYEWRMLTDPIQVIGNGPAQTIPHTLFPTRTVNIRCVVTDSDGTQYYDDYQLAKLANGAEGLDAYYIDLTNSTVNIPYDSSGNSPLVGLSTIYTEVYAYHGIEPITIESITPVVTQGTAEVSVSGNKVTLTSISTVSATIRLNIVVSDGVTLTKDWYINKTHDGENGFNGTDAAYVYLTGEQVFKYPQGASVPTNNPIILTATPYEIEDPYFTWYWSLTSTDDWKVLEGEGGRYYVDGDPMQGTTTANTLTVSHNGVYFSTNDSVAFRVECSTYDGGGVIYSDETNVIKVYDGKDGIGSYGCILTNMNHTVPANFNGEVDPTELARAKTEAQLWRGTDQLDKTEFTITQTLQSGNGTVSVDNANKTVTCTGLTSDSAVWRVHFLTDIEEDDGTVTQNKEVGVVDFTVSKSKGGEAGYQPVSIYCMTSSTPSRPTMSYRPSSSGSSSGGYTWYPDPTYSTSYSTWESHGNIDPNNGGVVVVDSGTGYRWTTPVKISGKDGAQGPRGEQGLPGRIGDSAYDIAVDEGFNGDKEEWLASLNGPGLNYRGRWESGKTYGWTAASTGNVRDIVRGHKNSESDKDDYYYMWNSYYKGTVITTSRPNQDYTTVDGTSGKHWVRFGASFESIATGLLFADKATIAGWEFTDEYIYSQSNTMRLDGRTNPLSNIHLAAGSNAASNPGNASFRVSKTGSLTANNATITGNITADYGRIGGFTINDTFLKYSSSGYGNILLGGDTLPSTMGSRGTSMVSIQNTNNAGTSTLDPTANSCLRLYSSGTANIRNALFADGDVYVKGGFMAVEQPYSVSGTTGTLDDASFYKRRTFVVPSVSSGNASMKLPDSADISKNFGRSVYGNDSIDGLVIEFVILVSGHASGILYVYGGEDNYYNRSQYLYEGNGQRLRDNSAISQDNVGCRPGSTTFFRYHNRNWYVFTHYGRNT